MPPAFDEPDDPNPPAQPAPPPPQDALPWGIIGTNLYARMFQGTRFGILRKGAGSGVSYHRPPLPADSPTWSDLGDGRFEMPIDSHVAPTEVKSLADLAVRSLETLREDLIRGNPADPALFRDLDRFAEVFLERVAHLHQQGCHVGLLHPRNVLIKGGSPDLSIILPDLGFARAGDMPGRRPAWLDIAKPLWRDWQSLLTQDDLGNMLWLTDAPQADSPPQFGKGG